MEMSVRGKHGKPNPGFPLFPPPLEIPQNRRDFHIPTASTTVRMYLGQAQTLTSNRQLGGGPN